LVEGARRLIDIVNTSVASSGDGAAAARELAPIVDRMEALVPTPVPSRLVMGERSTAPHSRNPFDVVHGLYNPIAPPLLMRHEPPDAVGVVTFGAAYEGPPGRVHGAVLVGAFDMVFSSANSVAGVTGPTASLRIQYERATRTGVPVEFRARQTGVAGRRIHVEGELRQGTVVTCRAVGVFIRLDAEDLHRLGGDDG